MQGLGVIFWQVFFFTLKKVEILVLYLSYVTLHEIYQGGVHVKKNVDGPGI